MYNQALNTFIEVAETDEYSGTAYWTSFDDTH